MNSESGYDLINRSQLVLSIIMPCLNEAETLERCLVKAHHSLSKLKINGEIIVGDNGSTDGSQEIAVRYGARVINVPMRGYGSALYTACSEAHGIYIIMGDSDDSYDFSELEPFLSKLSEGYDLVMGNRFLGGIKPGAMPWKNRFIGNPILTAIGRCLFRSTVGDFHFGLRGVRKDAFERMDLRTTGMEFASEMVIKATLYKMRISEVPTILHKDGRSRPPHLRPWRDGWRHLRFMFLFRPKWLFIVPGMFLSVFSLIIYMVLLMGPLRIGRFVFDIHTHLLSIIGIVVGCMAVCFGVIVRFIGMHEGLLPEKPILQEIRKKPVVEVGGVVSLFFVLSGLLMVGKAFYVWESADFGPMNPNFLIRLVSVGSVMCLIGSLTFFTSLVIGFISLPTRDDRLR